VDHCEIPGSGDHRRIKNHTKPGSKARVSAALFNKFNKKAAPKAAFAGAQSATVRRRVDI
jgi:hypothetical protein